MGIPSSTVSYGDEPRERIGINWKLVLAYDGTDFYGWQVQPGRRTIQGDLAQAIRRVTGEEVLPQGSGRTDAGVHARAQVASCFLNAPIPATNLVRALNRTLPEAIRILSAQPVDASFHARHSAVAKTYEYAVKIADPFANEICLPWQARFLYCVERPLNLEDMQRAAASVVGTHDFSSFAASDPDRAQRIQAAMYESAAESNGSNIRTIHRSTWATDANELLIYRVTGSGFLHHMVRNLVGTFLEVGWGERDAGEIPATLGARHRSAAGRTAPARGLCLTSVDYGPAARVR